MKMSASVKFVTVGFSSCVDGVSKNVNYALYFLFQENFDRRHASKQVSLKAEVRHPTERIQSLVRGR